MLIITPVDPVGHGLQQFGIVAFRQQLQVIVDVHKHMRVDVGMRPDCFGDLVQDVANISVKSDANGSFSISLCPKCRRATTTLETIHQLALKASPLAENSQYGETGPGVKDNRKSNGARAGRGGRYRFWELRR